MPTNSELVRSRIELTNPPRIAASEVLWNYARIGELVPWNLQRGYMVASASVPLMECALEQCERQPAEDSVAEGFARYLRRHIPEELGHDEQCLDDLEALGVSRDAVISQYPYPAIVSMLGMQYYWIRHRHPIAFAGYLAVIEGHPASAERIHQVQRDTGLPADAFRTLLWHADHDGEHTQDLDDLLDTLPLTNEDITLIGINIAHTNSLLARSVHEMIKAFESRTADMPGNVASRA